jgi:hypothetical protein
MVATGRALARMSAWRARDLTVIPVGKGAELPSITETGPYPPELSEQLCASWPERSAIAITRPARSLASIVNFAQCHARTPAATTRGGSDFVPAGANGARRTAARAT